MNGLAKWAERKAGSPKTRTLFHVTYAKHIEGIAEDGLKPNGGGGSLGRYGGYVGNSRGKTFLTDGAGVGFWHGKMEDHAHDRSDDPKGDGYTPIVLRVQAPRGHLNGDKVGSSDAMSKAYKTRSTIPPSRIEFLQKGEWIPISEHAKLDVDAAYEKPDEDGVSWSKQDHENPLHPRFEHHLDDGIKRDEHGRFAAK